jgi:hypothetical protein
VSGRLTADILVNALVRRVNGEGGSAAILHRGDAISGIILVQICLRGVHQVMLERIADLSGRYVLSPCGPRKGEENIEITQYVTRRLRSDPDLWLVELDIANGQQLAAEILCAG